ncbi:hypothetical protein FOL47_008231 [Perkinsus chesapeaki]|uniref:Uncharacterized protein n=1 Tax=Perkinsus chesapeaki TaxID=330153 RepID=A0A7J6LFB4_PERCH|nr:hypothetical protein FOL47_008231 [Perkinsus chesapeaki]
MTVLLAATVVLCLQRRSNPEGLQYSMEVLLNEPALEAAPVLPTFHQETPGGTVKVPTLKSSATRAAFQMNKKRVNEMERKSYGCSFGLKKYREAEYRLNLTMTNPAGGFKISSIEFKSYWELTSKVSPLSEMDLNISSLKEIERIGNGRLPKFNKVTENDLRDACLSFMVPTPQRVYDASTSEFIRLRTIEELKENMIVYTRSIARIAIPWTTDFWLSGSYAHLADDPDKKFCIVDCSQLRRIPKGRETLKKDEKTKKGKKKKLPCLLGCFGGNRDQPY